MGKKEINVSRRKKGEFYTELRGDLNNETMYYNEDTGVLRLKLIFTPYSANVSFVNSTGLMTLTKKTITNGVINGETTEAMSHDFIRTLLISIDRNYGIYSLGYSQELKEDWKTSVLPGDSKKLSAVIGVNYMLYRDKIKYMNSEIPIGYTLVDIQLHEVSGENEAVKKQALRSKLTGLNVSASGVMEEEDFKKQCYNKETKEIQVPRGLKSINYVDYYYHKKAIDISKVYPSTLCMKENAGRALSLSKTIASKLKEETCVTEVCAKELTLDLNASVAVSLLKQSGDEVYLNVGGLRVSKKNIEDKIGKGEVYTLRKNQKAGEKNDEIYIKDVTGEVYDKTDYKSRETVLGIDEEKYPQALAGYRERKRNSSRYANASILDTLELDCINHFEDIGYPGDYTKETYSTYLRSAWLGKRQKATSIMIKAGDKTYKITRKVS